ncbi:hypothetical protein K501DRAFT_269100 [Backusella circina FSU 941]|nr:hypothetical protein K501DRAFT_269100 [Backusella circina FSU 941]
MANTQQNYTFPIYNIKLEEEYDSKLLLQVVKSKISVCPVSNSKLEEEEPDRKLSLSQALPKPGSEKNNSLPHDQLMERKRVQTQEQIKAFIGCMVDEKMSLPQVSAKANIYYGASNRLEHKYLEDTGPQHPNTT